MEIPLESTELGTTANDHDPTTANDHDPIKPDTTHICVMLVVKVCNWLDKPFL